MVLLISYDLDDDARPERYQVVRDLIEAHAVSFVRPLYSQWLVETNEDVSAWSQRLVGVMSPEDRLLILRVATPYQGWLAQQTWDWLKEKLAGAATPGA